MLSAIAGILLVAIDVEVPGIAAAVAKILEKETHVELITPERTAVSARDLARCEERERLRCWARSSGARYLAVLSVAPSRDEKIEASIIFLDVDRVQAIARNAPHSARGEEVESKIWAEATKHTERTLSSRDDRALIAFVERAFREDLRPMLEKNGHWGAPPKQTVVPELVPPAPAHAPSSHTDVVFFGGMGVAAIGVGLTVLGIAGSGRASSAVLCDGAPCGDEQRTFTNFCELFSSKLSTCSAEKGLLVAPLGLALALTGGAWSIGASTFEHDAEWPWWSLLAGVVLGAVTYTASALAD